MFHKTLIQYLSEYFNASVCNGNLETVQMIMSAEYELIQPSARRRAPFWFQLCNQYFEVLFMVS